MWLCGNAPPLGALEVDHGASDVVGRVALEGNPNEELGDLSGGRGEREGGLSEGCIASRPGTPVRTTLLRREGWKVLRRGGPPLGHPGSNLEMCPIPGPNLHT